MRLFSSIRIIRASLALSVAFWMAGAGCLLGCQNMVSAAASSEVASPLTSAALVVSGEACASTHSHDCCAKRGNVSSKHLLVADSRKKDAAQTNDHPKVLEHRSAPTTPSLASEISATFPTMIDCPLAVNATAVLSKARPDHSSVALPFASELTSLSNSPEQISAFGRPLRLPNRGHTYLQCCVFLI